MGFANIRSKMVWILPALGALISAASLARSHWPWLAELCGLTASGCSHADLYELLGIPMALWGLIFYAAAGFIQRWARPWTAVWIMAGAGVELVLIQVMITRHFVCLFCLFNLLVIGLLSIFYFQRKNAWQSIAVCLMAYIVVNAMITSDAGYAEARCAPIAGNDVVARVNGRTITVTDLESEIAVRLNEMRRQIYYLKRNQLEELIRRALCETPSGAPGGEESNSKVLKEKTLRQARRILADFQQTRPGIDRYLERPVSPFARVRIDGSPQLGKADAKVTVIEFLDFRCPMCKFTHGIIKELKPHYGADLRWVFKDYPSPAHPQADRLAEAARCAYDQGRYWEYQDALFASDKKNDPAMPLQLAGALNLDLEKFTECFESRRYATAVQYDIDEARKLGISQTPSHLINGRLIVGPMSKENFKKQIDEALHR